MSWIEQPAQEIFQYEDKIFNLSQLAINEYYITYNLSVPNKNDFQLFTKKDECYRVSKNTIFSNCFTLIQAVNKLSNNYLFLVSISFIQRLPYSS